MILFKQVVPLAIYIAFIIIIIIIINTRNASNGRGACNWAYPGSGSFSLEQNFIRLKASH
jgi:hypothetical protein